MKQEDLEKLQKLYRDRYGKELSLEEAEDLGTRILGLLRVVYSPLNKKAFESLSINKQNYV